MGVPAKDAAKNVTLQKGLLILEALAEEAREFTVTGLAAQIGLGRSQTCEMLATLVASGYVIRNPRNRRYRIGLRALELSSDILARMEVRRAGLTYLYGLSLQTDAQALLGVLHRGAVLILDICYPGGRYAPTHPGFGARLSLANTAMGRVLLAHLPEVEQRGYCTEEELAALAPVFAETRRTGLGSRLAYEGETPVSIGYGAIVRDARGEIAALLGARIDWGKWERCDQDLFRDRVLAAAQGLSRALGYLPHLAARPHLGNDPVSQGGEGCC